MITERRAQQFHELVESQSTGGAGVPEQVDLLDVVHGLRAVPAPVADPAFVAALRERLIAEAESVLAAAAAERDDAESRRHTRPTARNTRRRHRRLAAVVGGVALLGTSATVAVAAQSALPGDGLYSVKRGLENTQAELTFDRADRGRLVLDNAGTRLDEAQQLSRERADPARVSDALDAFTEQAVEGSGLLIADYQATGNRSSMTTLRTFTVTSMDRLEVLQSQVPPQSYDSLLQAARVLEGVQQTSVRACSVCDGPLISSVPGVIAIAPRATADTWRLAVPKWRHDLSSPSDSSGGPSVRDVKRQDPASAGVANPGSSTAVPEQPAAGDVKHTVRHLTHGVTGHQRNAVPRKVSNTTDDLTDAAGDAASQVDGETDPLDDTVGGIGSQLPTLP